MKMKKTLTFLALISASLLGGLLTSCGTVHGVGHDIEHVGDEIQEAARGR